MLVQELHIYACITMIWLTTEKATSCQVLRCEITEERIMTEYREIIGETIEQLSNIMDVSFGQRMKDVAKKALGRSVRTKDPMFWPSGMLMLGLASTLESEGAKEALIEHIKRWREDYNGRIDFVDDALAGFSMIKLFESTRDDKIAKAIEDIYNYLKDSPKDKLGAIIYNPGKGNTNIFADGIGQSVMFLSSHINMKLKNRSETFRGETNTNIEYYSESDYLAEIQLVYSQLVNFYTYGRDNRSGLIYHGYSLVDKPQPEKDGFTCEKKGLLGWGRAVGWIMLGLSEAALMEKNLSIGNKAVKEWSFFDIIPWYNDMVRVVLDYQRQDGAWSWLIQAVEGHIDMSATGMIAYSLARGITYGVISEDLLEITKAALSKAKTAMLEHTENGVVKDALSSCDDFGVHYQNYGVYPWGQGAVLAALAAYEMLS